MVTREKRLNMEIRNFLNVDVDQIAFVRENFWLVRYKVAFFFRNIIHFENSNTRGNKLFQRPRGDSRTLKKYSPSDTLLFQSFTTPHTRNLSDSVNLISPSRVPNP